MIILILAIVFTLSLGASCGLLWFNHRYSNIHDMKTNLIGIVLSLMGIGLCLSI